MEPTAPTLEPTNYPTSPTMEPTMPTHSPSRAPTVPTMPPTDDPTVSPTPPTESPTQSPSSDPTAAPTATECALGINYFVPGTPCTSSGDPHYSLWNGARHDYQGGGAEGMYYYVSPCKGSHHEDMPFDILGKHRVWMGAVQGLEYLIFALFGNGEDEIHYLYFSASFQAVIDGSDLDSLFYDDNVGSNAMTKLSPGSSTNIGSRFKLYVGACREVP